MLVSGHFVVLADNYRVSKGADMAFHAMTAIGRSSTPFRSFSMNNPGEGAGLRYLNAWIDQLRWQQLRPFQKLAEMLLRHQEGILNYCRTKVPFGVVEAVNGNIKALLRRGREYRNLHYLLLKAQPMAVQKTEFVVFRKAA
jgi:hypothetical protein